MTNEELAGAIGCDSAYAFFREGLSELVVTAIWGNGVNRLARDFKVRIVGQTGRPIADDYEHAASMLRRTGVKIGRNWLEAGAGI